MTDIEDIMKNFDLDIDLEELSKKCYEDDRNYLENFSNWYPHIKNFSRFKTAEIISNQIFTYDEVKILQKTDNIKDVNWDEINNILKPTLEKMEPNRLYNIKNGCFSNKFDFDTCITNKMDLAEKLWKINYQSALYETGGHTELVVRELIPFDPIHDLTIYNGMPLRTEVRAFYNMDKKKLEYTVDYWSYNYCYEQLPTLIDKLAFNAFFNKFDNWQAVDHEIELMLVMNYIEENINTLKFDDTLHGIWSIDFLYDRVKGDIYLIDMARGFKSAYYYPDRIEE